MFHSKRFIPFAVTILFLYLLTGCELFPQEETLLAPPLMKPIEVSYSTVEAKRGDIVQTVRGTATFTSIESENMFFETRGGRLKDIHVRLGDEIQKGDLIAELYSDDVETEIKRQKLNLQKVQLSYNQLKAANASTYDLKRASIDIELAKLSLDSLEQQKKESQLVSEVNGVVTYVDTRLNSGDIISSFQTLIIIANPQNLILAYTGSNNSSFYMSAEVDVEMNNNTYKGKVISTPSSVPPDGDENLKNYIAIEVAELPDDVGMGDTAQISLILQQSHDTVIVPKQAIRNYMGRRYVNILEDGLNSERDVKIGVETATESEILEGVEEGEEIILR